MKVLEDVKKVIKLGKQKMNNHFVKLLCFDFQCTLILGKKYIIKRFCEIHSLFNNACEPRYILNQLYISNYLVWLQQVHESVIESLYALIVNVSMELITNKMLQTIDMHVFLSRFNRVTTKWDST